NPGPQIRFPEISISGNRIGEGIGGEPIGNAAGVWIGGMISVDMADNIIAHSSHVGLHVDGAAAVRAGRMSSNGFSDIEVVGSASLDFGDVGVGASSAPINIRTTAGGAYRPLDFAGAVDCVSKP